VSSPAVICFDVFGTLIGYTGKRINPYRRLSADQAARLPFLTRDVPIEVFADELGLNYLLPIIRHELDTEIKGLQVFPDVALVLRKLRASGKRVAVCSNLAHEYGSIVRQLLPGLDAYVFSFEAGVAKPDAKIYDAVCQRLGSRPRDVLFIGDSKRCDLHGPQAFGMQARWLDRKGGKTLPDCLEGILR
jgi:HAD superfamily hydrolase (TIGR01509 family)